MGARPAGGYEEPSGGTSSGEPAFSSHLSRRDPKNGVAKFSFHLKRGTFAPDLADDGLANATANNVYLPTRVKVRLGSTTLEETFPLVWNVAAGGVGVAK